jgi:tetratricopeptide (TPR) repeat protein
LIVTLVFALLAAAPPPGARPRPSFADVSHQAAAAREADRVEEAIGLYRRGVRMRPAWDEGWWYLGTLLYDQDRHADAARAFEKFVELKPDSAPGWALRGICEFQNGNHDGALRHLRRAVKLGLKGEDPIAQSARYHLAALLVRGSEFELAVEPLTGLARSQPEGARLVETIGLMMLRLPYLPNEVPAEKRELVQMAGAAGYAYLARQGDVAARRFEALTTRYPSAPNVHYAYGVYLLGQDPDRALAAFKKEVEVQPDSVYARLEIAFELLKRTDAAAARPYAEEAARLAPRLFATRYALGRALVELGDVQAGIVELETAAGLAPDSPEMHFALARAYSRAGREADAERARDTFRALDQRRRGP